MRGSKPHNNQFKYFGRINGSVSQCAIGNVKYERALDGLVLFNLFMENNYQHWWPMLTSGENGCNKSIASIFPFLFYWAKKSNWTNAPKKGCKCLFLPYKLESELKLKRELGICPVKLLKLKSLQN